MTDHRALINVAEGPVGFPFLNFLKWGTAFGADPNNVNANGSPTTTPSTPQNSNRTNFRVPPSTAYSGTYVLTTLGGAQTVSIDTGDAVVSLTPATGASASGNVVTLDGANRRCVFTTASTAGNWIFNFVVTGTFSSTAGEVCLCRLADESAWLAYIADRAINPTTITHTQRLGIFNPDYIADWKALNPRAIRMAQWTRAGEFWSTCSQPYSLMKPLEHITWQDNYYPTSPWVGNNGSGAGNITGTNTYAAAAAPTTPGSVTSGEMFYGVILNTNTGASTLNVAGRGAKSLIDYNGIALTAGYLAAGQAYNFTYDAILDAYACVGGGQGIFGIQQYIPLNVMVALCNEVGCGIWYNIPHLISDAEMALVANAVATWLTPGLPDYWEFGIEMWGGLTWPDAYTRNWGTFLGTTTGNSYAPCSYKSRVMFEIIGNNRAGRGISTLRRVIEGRTNNSNVEWQDSLLNGTLFGSFGGGSPWNVSPNRPVDYTECLAVAPYLASDALLPSIDSLYTAASSQDNLYFYADEYASNDPTRMAAALSFVDTELRTNTSSGFGYYGAGGGSFSRLNTLAQGYDSDRNSQGKALLEIVNYEGGLGIGRPTTARMTAIGRSTTYGGNGGKIDNLYQAYKATADAKQLILDHFTNFVNAGVHNITPGYYVFAGDATDDTAHSPDINQWSIYDNGLYSTKWKTYDALAEWGLTAEGLGETVVVTPVYGKARKTQIHSQGPWAYRR